MAVNVQQYEYVTQAGDTAGIVVGILPQQQMPFHEDDDVITSWSTFCLSSRCLSLRMTASSSAPDTPRPSHSYRFEKSHRCYCSGYPRDALLAQ